MESFLKEKPFGTHATDSDPRRENQNSYKENNEAHPCPCTRDLAKTTDEPMSSQHRKVLLRKSCESMARLDACKTNAMIKRDIKTGGSSVITLQCTSCFNKKGNYYMQKYNRCNSDAEYLWVSPYSSVSKASALSPSEKRGKRLDNVKSICYELFEKRLKSIDSLL